MGRGVKKMVEAKEKIKIAIAKPLKLSCLSRPSHGKPSISREEDSIPRKVKSSYFSMPTSRLSKIIKGSAIKKTDKTKATRLKPLHKYRVYVAMTAKLREDAKANNPIAKPARKPISVRPS